MQEIIIGKNEAGQRFDKYLFKYFKEAPSGFIYKMLRKKNIVLNGKKSDGRDKLNEKDIIKVFMADETIEKFRGIKDTEIVTPVDLDIVYEDENVVFINKPSGMLSQKAADSDISVNEYLISYLVNKGELTRNDLLTFKPGICNRLDRNTSGLIVAGKSLAGLQEMALMFKERMMDKYYLALVEGTVKELADKYHIDIMTMVGFLDGINDSLKEANPIEEMEEDTKVNLGFEKSLLYKNMVAAGADWLYELEEWNDIFDEDTRKSLYKEQKESTTIHKAPKVYPNDPCPCGSGKKYKKCCGRNA